LIHDVVIRRLSQQQVENADRWPVLAFADPLLHRVGWIDLWRMESGEQTRFRVRPEADEVWLLISGACTFAWHDQRETSPTKGERQWHMADGPTLVLAPFGVGFGVLAEADCQLLRLATEDEAGDEGGLPLPWIER
jgi:hypothetical protein